MPRFVIDCVAELQQAGFTTFVSGGSVRDLLLDKTPTDYDVATEATPQQVRRVFKRRAQIIGRRYPIVHVWQDRKRHEFIEVVTFRKVPTVAEISNPKCDYMNLYCKSPAEDARRRDLTVNAFLFDPSSGQLNCSFDADTDILERRARMIGDAGQRLRQDPARVFRSIRLAKSLNLEIDSELTQALKQSAPQVTLLSEARLQLEFSKLISSRGALGSLKTLHEYSSIGALVGSWFDDWLRTDDQAWSAVEGATTIIQVQKSHWLNNLRKEIALEGLWISAVWKLFILESKLDTGRKLPKWSKRYRQTATDIIDSLKNGRISPSAAQRENLLRAVTLQFSLHKPEVFEDEAYLKRPSFDLGLLLFLIRQQCGESVSAPGDLIKKAMAQRSAISSNLRRQKRQKRTGSRRRRPASKSSSRSGAHK